MPLRKVAVAATVVVVVVGMVARISVVVAMVVGISVVVAMVVGISAVARTSAVVGAT